LISKSLLRLSPLSRLPLKEVRFDKAVKPIVITAVSHEIQPIAERLAYRTGQIADYLRAQAIKDSKLVAYVEYVNSSINA
jgi:hypothetical protein